MITVFLLACHVQVRQTTALHVFQPSITTPPTLGAMLLVRLTSQSMILQVPSSIASHAAHYA